MTARLNRIIRTTGELYPPTQPDEIAAIRREVVASSGVRRALTASEAERVRARLTVVDHWMRRGDHDAMVTSINFMISGMSDAPVSDAEAEVEAAQYAYICRDLPWWAVERACTRFASGQVRPAEIGGERVSLRYAPSSAQLNVIATRIAAPLKSEQDALKVMLAGNVIAPTPREDGKTIPGNVQAWLDMRRMSQRGATVERDLRIAAEAGARAEIAERQRRKGFADAGVELPPPRMCMSLAWYLEHDWTIETLEGRKVLMSPTRNQPTGDFDDSLEGA